MKNKILSLILAVLMIVSTFAFAACGDDASKPPIGGDTAGPANDGGSENAGGDTPDETDPPETEGPTLEANGLDAKYFSEFVPDSDAQFTGKVGIGANKAGVDFDTFRVISADRKDIYEEEFEEITELNSAIFTESDLSAWTIGADDTDEGNKALTAGAESKIFMGNTEWGPYRVNVKVKVADETEAARIYFCVKDEKNYHYLEVTTAYTKVVKATDGKEETVSEIALGVAAEKWIPLSVFLSQDTVMCYADGDEVIRIYAGESDNELVVGQFGLLQWATQYSVDNYKVVDIETGEVYYENDFEDEDFISKCKILNRVAGSYTNPKEGDWVIENGVDNDGNPTDNKVISFKGDKSLYGAMIIFPDEVEIPADCKGYKVMIDAYRYTGSDENGEFVGIVWGFTSDNDYKVYNFGGWSGCGGYQDFVAGVKTNHEMTNKIGMQNNFWSTCESQIYADVVYSYFNGNLIQINWLD